MFCKLRLYAGKIGLVGDGRYSNDSLLGRPLVPASLICRPASSKAKTPKGSSSWVLGTPKLVGTFDVSTYARGTTGDVFFVFVHRWSGMLLMKGIALGRELFDGRLGRNWCPGRG